MHYLYFTSEHCGPCKALKSRILKHPEIAIIDVEKHNEKASQYGVMNIPTIIALDNCDTIEYQVSGSRISKWLNETFKE